MNDTGCKPWQGPARMYQQEAVDYLAGHGRPVARWGWVVPDCDTPTCLAVDHLTIHQPTVLAYPRRICCYCGRSANTRDHLLPRPWTGTAARHMVATVPACGTCNALLSDTITVSITERRQLAHTRIKRKFRKVLATQPQTAESLAEYGPTLRAYIEDAIASRQAVLDMLAWPTDPAYDLRACQRSGIDDPYQSGLLLGAAA